MLILLYGCTTWMQTKHMEKKLDGNDTRMLQVILNKSWRQHPTKQQLYGHLPPMMKTIQVRQIRHAGHFWRSREKLISDVLPWTPSHEQAKAGWPARTYIEQLCADTGCSLQDLSGVMDNKESWWERVREIRAGGATWWWWWLVFDSSTWNPLIVYKQMKSVSFKHFTLNYLVKNYIYKYIYILGLSKAKSADGGNDGMRIIK